LVNDGRTIEGSEPPRQQLNRPPGGLEVEAARAGGVSRVSLCSFGRPWSARERPGTGRPRGRNRPPGRWARRRLC